MKSSKYIGINYNGCHDSNISYFTHKVEFAVSEERFSRVKKDGRPPKHSLKFLFNNFDVDLESTKFVFPILPKKESHKLWKKEGLEEILKIIEKKLDFGIKYTETFTEDPIYVSHQNAHAASAYFTSKFHGRSLILVIDAGNYSDPYCVSLYEGYRGKLKLLEQNTNRSIAQGYLVITAILGFTPMQHEGKITGLASYGTENKELTKDMTSVLEDDDILYNTTRWENFGKRRNPPKLIVTKNVEKTSWFTKKYPKEDIAYAIQKITENKVLRLIQKYRNKYENICLAGGVFANVTLNRKISELGFQNLFIHPAMGDDGLSLGAVLYTKSLQDTNFKPFELSDLYWGPEYNTYNIKSLSSKYRVKYEERDDIETTIASILNKGKIVARYSGRMEYGPRALGNRSILYRADKQEINTWLNKKLNRTEFMPFAPVVPDYRAIELFEDFERGEYAANFMTTTFKCTQKMKNLAPAAVHVDGTARPQVVNSEVNPSYYKILEVYDKITKGNSILINTSFNMHGEPIVLTPEDAIKSFKESTLDFLALDNYLITLQ